LCTIHYNDAERLERARPLILESYRIGLAPRLQGTPLVHQIIGDGK